MRDFLVGLTVVLGFGLLVNKSKKQDSIPESKKQESIPEPIKQDFEPTVIPGVTPPTVSSDNLDAEIIINKASIIQNTMMSQQGVIRIYNNNISSVHITELAVETLPVQKTQLGYDYSIEKLGADFQWIVGYGDRERRNNIGISSDVSKSLLYFDDFSANVNWHSSIDIKIEFLVKIQKSLFTYPNDLSKYPLSVYFNITFKVNGEPYTGILEAKFINPK